MQHRWSRFVLPSGCLPAQVPVQASKHTETTHDSIWEKSEQVALLKYETADSKLFAYMQVCNHPALSYPPLYIMDGPELLHQCGKFAVLDRMLVKLHATGHRVLLFSTMTKLLDLLEQYLRWRAVGPDNKRMGYLRIDGATSLEDRWAGLCCTFICRGGFPGDFPLIHELNSRSALAELEEDLGQAIDVVTQQHGSALTRFQG